MSNASIRVVETDVDKPTAAVEFLEAEVERARDAVASANRKLDRVDLEHQAAALARDDAEAALTKALKNLDAARAATGSEG